MTERDRPDDEIEVTQEMIRAGAKVIIDYFHLAPDWLPNDISLEVYRAMTAARPEVDHLS
jgi:hypothetical protein